MVMMTTTATVMMMMTTVTSDSHGDAHSDGNDHHVLHVQPDDVQHPFPTWDP